MISNYRKNMCKHCAFRPESIEMTDPAQREALEGGCLTKVFYCHETMYQIESDKDKWSSSFDPTRKRDGSPAKPSDHQVCNGFAEIYGEEFLDG